MIKHTYMNEYDVKWFPVQVCFANITQHSEIYKKCSARSSRGRSTTCSPRSRRTCRGSTATTSSTTGEQQFWIELKEYIRIAMWIVQRSRWFAITKLGWCHLRTTGTASPWQHSRSARRCGLTWLRATSSSSTGWQQCHHHGWQGLGHLFFLERVLQRKHKSWPITLF